MSESTESKEGVHQPEQEEMPFAMVQGEPFTTPPTDLYIPPDALEVFLDAFEGPLDLLLYLIKRQNLDILDIPIAEITDHPFMVGSQFHPEFQSHPDDPHPLFDALVKAAAQRQLERAETPTARPTAQGEPQEA